jgi:mRNA interferase RelE/StbE
MTTRFKKSFFKDYERLPKTARIQIKHVIFDRLPAIVTLEEIENVKSLAGSPGFYRIRVGDYRIGFII